VDAVLCVEALKETLVKYGAPEIYNTDEGSQVTSGDWADVLTDVKLKISREGKGGWIKNCIIERLWRSLKDECVYLHVLRKWMAYYNTESPHATCGIMTHGILTLDEA